MAFVGFQRNDTVCVGGGSDAALVGTQPRAQLKRFELGQVLLPDIRYRMRATADLASRRFSGGSRSRVVG